MCCEAGSNHRALKLAAGLAHEAEAGLPIRLLVQAEGSSRWPHPGSTAAGSRSDAGVAAALWSSVRDGESPLFVNVDNASAILHVLEATKEAEKLQLAMIALGPNVYLNIENLDSDRLTLVLPPRIDLKPSSAIRINVPSMLANRGQEFISHSHWGKTISHPCSTIHCFR